MGQLEHEHVFDMTLVSLAEAGDNEKLHILRRHDVYRRWQSLDEKRYCLVCGEFITGREIRVFRRKAGNESRHVACPTKCCNATPIEWVWPTDDVLIKIAMIELERSRLRMIGRAARETRFLPMENGRSTIKRTNPEPPFR